MIAICREAGLPEPEFRQDGGQWTVTLWRDWLTVKVLAELQLNDRQRQAITLLKTAGRLSNADYQKLTNPPLVSDNAPCKGPRPARPAFLDRSFQFSPTVPPGWPTRAQSAWAKKPSLRCTRLLEELTLSSPCAQVLKCFPLQASQPSLCGFSFALFSSFFCMDVHSRARHSSYLYRRTTRQQELRGPPPSAITPPNYPGSTYEGSFPKCSKARLSRQEPVASGCQKTRFPPDCHKLLPNGDEDNGSAFHLVFMRVLWGFQMEPTVRIGQGGPIH